MRSMVEGADSAPGLSDWFLATWGWGRVCVGAPPPPRGGPPPPHGGLPVKARLPPIKKGPFGPSVC
jgi:hypothetical protein